MATIKIECLTVEGTPEQMGRAHGEHFRERIRSFMDQRFNAVEVYMVERGGHPEHGLLHAARASMDVGERWDPDGHREHLGIAEGAGVDPVELYTAANMTDMRDVILLSDPRGPYQAPVPGEGCSAVLVPQGHGGPLAGQTWDLNPEDLDYVVAIRRRPHTGPQTWAISCVGCLTLMGINEHGVAVGTTNIKTYGSRPGPGYLSILHRVVRSGTAAEAMKAAQRAPHAGAHTYWFADRDGQFELEASPNARILRDTRRGPIARTNHCLTKVHQDIEGEAPSESSQRRLARIQARFAEGPLEIDSLKALFADRSDGVHSINRYPEDGESAATNAVFIAVPVERRAVACRGPADRGQWTDLRFD